MQKTKLIGYIVIGVIFGSVITGGTVYFTLNKQIVLLDEKNGEYEQEVLDLNSEIDSLEQEVIDLNSIIDSLEQENIILQSELTSKLQIIEEYKQEITELNSEINQNECIQIEFLANQDYYYSILDNIQRANESISVYMYSMKYDEGDPMDWANDLIEELALAQNRGISVEVNLEYVTFFDVMYDNMEAYNYLDRFGVDVNLDYQDDTDHEKMVIIDDKIIYLGSHNWTESSLYYNKEVSVKITEVN